jgi:hypothetical protein
VCSSQDSSPNHASKLKISSNKQYVGAHSAVDTPTRKYNNKTKNKPSIKIRTSVATFVFVVFAFVEKPQTCFENLKQNQLLLNKQASGPF